MKQKITVIAVLLFLSSAYIYPQIKINDQASKTHMKSNLTFLASDELEGRETGERGEKLAALFIASEMEKYGIKPFGDNGTYFQDIKLVSAAYDSLSKIAFALAAGGTGFEIDFGDDFLKAGNSVCDASFLKYKSSVVFVKFGITAPEFNYDDYKDIDVKGKVVLLLPDEPYSEDNNFFNGKKNTQYSDARFKINNALNHGAAGVLLISESWRIKFWSNFKKTALRGFFNPEEKDIKNVKTIPAFYLNENAAKKLLEGEVFTWEKFVEFSDKQFDIKPFELKRNIQFNLKDNTSIKHAQNVVGLIEGTDKKLKNEYVLLSAHYDHIGTRNGIVNNGADDDGSGTVGVLEVGRILKENKGTKRSIVILLVTGEEKGLWGSAHAANYSEFIPNTVANINIDMIGREHPDSIHVIGSNKMSTEYYNLIRDVNSKTVKMGFNYKYDDPNDPQRFFYRSDHYNFALKGIPIVFFFDDMKKDYHRPTDDIEKIDFDKMLKVVKLSVNIASRVANLDHRLVVDKKLEVRGRRD